MKFIRVGEKGKEIVGVIDSNNKIRNISDYIEDLNPDTINFKNLEHIKKINLENLPEIKQKERIGSCISRPGDFLAIGPGLFLQSSRSHRCKNHRTCTRFEWLLGPNPCKGLR